MILVFGEIILLLLLLLHGTFNTPVVNVATFIVKLYCFARFNVNLKLLPGNGVSSILPIKLATQQMAHNLCYVITHMYNFEIV